MILVKFGGDWPWGTDEVEECHGYFDAAYVVSRHGPEGVSKLDRNGLGMVELLAKLLSSGQTGSMSLGNSRFLEAKQR